MQHSREICSQCVMDISDSEITFNENGVCCHCQEFENVTSKHWFPNEVGRKKLESILSKIRSDGINKEYDCIVGLSGGVDSSYLALVLKEYKLRPLVLHVDAGWNSQLAVNNIEQIVSKLNYDLHTHVIDWEEIKDLQVAYLRASVANQDVVQDHAIFASLYHYAVKNDINYVISGGNIATESILPRSWQHAALDSINLLDIHRRFGKKEIHSYPIISFFEYYFYYPIVRKMRVVRPLNYMVYDKKIALQTLKDDFEFQEYGLKHCESIFTKFFQNYYLPTKFKIDKRRAHLSSQILAGQITRDQALHELTIPLYNPSELNDDLSYIAKKLHLTNLELQTLISAPPANYNVYANWDSRYKLLKSFQSMLERLLKRNLRNYAY